ncbi:MAG: hypothetical protein EAZ99_05630 [Alphaproteobacteria bacterium]|nr:hypothetical protein [Alphaproteobacteria bacterium]TAD90532.1 MAG: hypothetical protein EAZ99_05630 [Alphaproteobacteria bacterium]
MKTKHRPVPYTIEHFGEQGWHVVAEAQRLETAMLRARAIFRVNPLVKLRLVARLQAGRRRVYDLKAPETEPRDAPAPTLARQPTPDYAQVAERADHLVLGLSLTILSMAIFNAWPMAVRLGL